MLSCFILNNYRHLYFKELRLEEILITTQKLNIPRLPRLYRNEKLDVFHRLKVTCVKLYTNNVLLYLLSTNTV